MPAPSVTRLARPALAKSPRPRLLPRALVAARAGGAQAPRLARRGRRRPRSRHSGRRTRSRSTSSGMPAPSVTRLARPALAKSPRPRLLPRALVAAPEHDAHCRAVRPPIAAPPSSARRAHCCPGPSSPSPVIPRKRGSKDVDHAAANVRGFPPTRGTTGRRYAQPVAMRTPGHPRRGPTGQLGASRWTATAAATSRPGGWHASCVIFPAPSGAALQVRDRIWNGGRSRARGGSRGSDVGGRPVLFFCAGRAGKGAGA